MLYREIIAVCSETHTKHINTLRGQNVELLNVKPAWKLNHASSLTVGPIPHSTVRSTLQFPHYTYTRQNKQNVTTWCTLHPTKPVVTQPVKKLTSITMFTKANNPIQFFAKLSYLFKAFQKPVYVHVPYTYKQDFPNKHPFPPPPPQKKCFPYTFLKKKSFVTFLVYTI
jgi:hypothetical protein